MRLFRNAGSSPAPDLWNTCFIVVAGEDLLLAQALSARRLRCVYGPVRPRVHTTHTIWYIIYVAMKRAVTMVDERYLESILLLEL